MDCDRCLCTSVACASFDSAAYTCLVCWVTPCLLLWHYLRELSCFVFWLLLIALWFYLAFRWARRCQRTTRVGWQWLQPAQLLRFAWDWQGNTSSIFPFTWFLFSFQILWLQRLGLAGMPAENTGLCLGGFVSAVTKRQGRELVQEMPAPRCSALRVLVPEAAPWFSPAAGAAELEEFSPVSCMEQPPTASAVCCAGLPGFLSLFLLHIAILKVAMGHRIGKRVQAASRLISAYVIFSTWSSLS